MAFLFLILSFRISRKVKQVKNIYKIQDGKITYSDLNKPAKPLFSKIYRIAGKPDYIIEKNKNYVPVEVKSGAYETPQKSHIFQIAAYCQLVEENYKRFVTYGILVYNENKQFIISFDPKLRFELENSIKKMRHALYTGQIERNHDDLYKCKNCSMRTYCQIKLI